MYYHATSTAGQSLVRSTGSRWGGNQKHIAAAAAAALCTARTAEPVDLCRVQSTEYDTEVRAYDSDSCCIRIVYTSL